jgi:hypothetical protein
MGSQRGLQPSVNQRRRFDDYDLETLIGITVAKPEMGHGH